MWIDSPSLNAMFRPPMRTVWSRVDIRCISMRLSPSFHMASCRKALRSKSAPASRFSRRSKIEIEGSGHAGSIIVGRKQQLSDFSAGPHRAGTTTSAPSDIRAEARNAVAAAGSRLPIVEPGKNPMRGEPSGGSCSGCMKSATTGTTVRLGCVCAKRDCMARRAGAATSIDT